MTPDPSEVQALFARHYFYFALLASLGALQVAVSLGGYRGMWLMPGRLLTRFTGVVLIISGIALFFLLPLWTDGPWAAGSVEADSSTRMWGKADWNDLGAARNVNDVDGGLAGTGQATWFPLSALIAGLVSISAGAVNLKLFPSRMSTTVPGRGRDLGDPDGVELMVDVNYFSALKRSWATFRREIPNDADRELKKSDRWSIPVQIWERWFR